MEVHMHPLHVKAVSLVRNYLACEAQLIEVLQEIERDGLFRRMGFTSMHQYALSLGLSDAQAFTFVGVARKCEQVPELKAAIASGELSVSKAKRVLPVIKVENAISWI